MTDMLAVVALIVAIVAAAASLVLWASYETIYVRSGNVQITRQVAKRRLEGAPT